MRLPSALAAFVGLLLTCSCNRAVELSSDAPLAPKAGHIVGMGITSDGHPVKTFTVHYSGFEEGKLADVSVGQLVENVGGNVEGKDGRFDIAVPSGAYRASAYVTYRWHERDYHFELEPTNAPSRHDYNSLGLDNLGKGLVRDFVLRMTGKKADAWEDSETGYRNAYYGGTLNLEARQVEGQLGGGAKFTTALRDAYPKDSQVEITLTPKDTLVDGSKGQPIITKLPLGDDGKWTFCVRGILPGAYTATARLIPPAGGAVPLRLSLTPARTVAKQSPGGYDAKVMDWQSSTTVEFLPNDLGPEPRFGVKAMSLYLGK
jgi:hypothetical protein